MTGPGANEVMQVKTVQIVGNLTHTLGGQIGVSVDVLAATRYIQETYRNAALFDTSFRANFQYRLKPGVNGCLREADLPVDGC